MKKITKLSVLLAVILSFAACGTTARQSEQSADSSEKILQITSAQGLVNYFLGYFDEGREQYIVDKDVAFTHNQRVDRIYREIGEEQVLVEFDAVTDTFKSKDGSYYYEFFAQLSGQKDVPAKYYFIETQKTVQYGLKEDLKRYISFVSTQDRFLQYGVIDESVQVSARDYYWVYENAEEYAELHKRNMFGILSMYFNNAIFANAFNGDFSDLTDAKYDYTLIHDMEISQDGARVDFSFRTEDLEGRAYGTNSGKQVFTDVTGYVDVESYALYIENHRKVYKEELLWHEVKYDFSVTPNDEAIEFVLDKEYELSIDAKEW